MKLCKQIWNERRHNFGIWLELFVVSVILWFIIDMLYVTSVYYTEPQGLDIEHTYLLDFQSVRKNSPHYKTEEQSGYTNGSAILEILSRLRQDPDIESACVSEIGSPYGLGYSMVNGQIDTISRVFAYSGITSDFLKVFRCRGMHGETLEDLVDILNRNEVLLSNRTFPEEIKKETLTGRNLRTEKKEYTVGAVIIPQKEADYQILKNDALYMLLTEKDILKRYAPTIWWNINVRVKESADKDFTTHIFERAGRFRVGNLLLSNVRLVSDIRDTELLKDSSKIQNKVYVALFLLLNIFLGILGTFWFRTQKRRSEIALLRAIGCNRAQIYKRIIGEGFIILLAASLCAWFVDLLIAYMGLTTPLYGEMMSVGRFVLTESLTLLSMLIMVFIGIMVPARQSRKIEISTTLHED